TISLRHFRARWWRKVGVDAVITRRKALARCETSTPLIMGHADADAESSKRTGQPAQTARFKPQGASLLTASTMICRSRRAPTSTGWCSQSARLAEAQEVSVQFRLQSPFLSVNAKELAQPVFQAGPNR